MEGKENGHWNMARTMKPFRILSVLKKKDNLNTKFVCQVAFIILFNYNGHKQRRHSVRLILMALLI